MKSSNSNRITKNQYMECMRKEPKLLEIFDFLNEDGNQFFNIHKEHNPQEQVIFDRLDKLDEEIEVFTLFLRSNFFQVENINKYKNENLSAKKNVAVETEDINLDFRISSIINYSNNLYSIHMKQVE